MIHWSNQELYELISEVREKIAVLAYALGYRFIHIPEQSAHWELEKQKLPTIGIKEKEEKK